MKWFYIRWGGILLAVCIVGLLGIQRYDREVTTISPEQLLQHQPSGTVRVLGTVQAGSLSASDAEEASFFEASFNLAGKAEAIMIKYAGEKPDNLRELKTLVVIGQWDPSNREFRAREISILPNYGYVTAAYLLAMIPIGLFLFRMERRVELLYSEIKRAKVYEPEEVGFDKG